MASFLFGALAREFSLDAPYLPPGNVNALALQHRHHFQFGRGASLWRRCCLYAYSFEILQLSVLVIGRFPTGHFRWCFRCTLELDFMIYIYRFQFHLLVVNLASTGISLPLVSLCLQRRQIKPFNRPRKGLCRPICNLQHRQPRLARG